MAFHLISRRGTFGRLATHPTQMFWFDFTGILPGPQEDLVYCHDIQSNAFAFVAVLNAGGVARRYHIRMPNSLGERALQTLLEVARQAASMRAPITGDSLCLEANDIAGRAMSEDPIAYFRTVAEATVDRRLMLERVADAKPPHFFALSVTDAKARRA